MMGWVKWAGAGLLAAIVALGYAMRIGKKLERADVAEERLEQIKHGGKVHEDIKRDSDNDLLDRVSKPDR